MAQLDGEIRYNFKQKSKVFLNMQVPSSLAFAVFELSLNMGRPSTLWREDPARQTLQLNNIAEEDSDLFLTSSSESHNQNITSNDFSNDLTGGDEIMMKSMLPRS